MPTDIDLKLAHDLAEFRVDAEKRFGSIEIALGGIRSELAWVKRIGGFLVAILLATGLGAGRIIWDAATIVADGRQAARRLDQVEKRLDAIDGKLDILIGRTAPAPKPGGGS